ncbi:MAG: TIGR02556 family CRISPR-associated protein, partial [ANME-2 cluster archaeon]
TLSWEGDDFELIKDLNDCLEINKDVIISELSDKIKNFDNKENGIISILINDGTEKYLGEIPIFRHLLATYSISDYINKYDTKSIAKDVICSVCNTHASEVYGFVDTYKFYTVDKPGFVSGGFDQQFAWKNYPVCQNCAIKLEAGKKYVEQFLDYKFYTLKYYIIPKFFQSEVDSDILKLLKEFKENSENGNIKLKDKYDNLLLDTEDDVFYILKRQKNSLVNNLMFYEESNAAFRILLYIEDILPSRLRTLFDKKGIVDKRTIFKEFSVDGKALTFTFENIWHFFPQNQEHDLSKYFLEIIHKIFVGMKINYPFLMSAIITKIRNDFSNNRNTKLSSHRGLQLLDYLNNLDILDNFDGGAKMNEINNDEIFGRSTTQFDEKVNKMFAEFPDFFGEPAKRAVFLEGGLAQLLLNIQHQERGAQPFRTKLHGLKLDEKLVKRLLPEMQNKLEEYNKNYYQGLEALISKYMVKAGDGWNISKDEISFYFVLGMNLHYLLKSNSNKENETTEGEINE